MKKLSLRPIMASALCWLIGFSAFAGSGDVQNGRKDLEIIKLQNVKFNGSGFSEYLEFTIPSNAKSFLVQFSSDSDYSGILFDSIADPNGHLVAGKSIRKFDYVNDHIKDDFPFMEWENPVLQSTFTGVATALIGNNTKTKIIPGQWRVRFKCESKTSECSKLKGTVDIVVKKNISVSKTPTIPLRLHFSGKSKWTAKSAAKSKDFRLFMQVLTDIFKYSGLNVEVLSMDDTEDTIFKNRGQGLLHMLKYSKGDAVNVYFVKTDLDWLGRATVAVSYELPGAYMSPYTTGVMIRTKTILTEEQRKSPNRIDRQVVEDRLSIPQYALVTAHEIGHYLGLYHVCEVPVMGVPMGVEDPLESKCDYKNMMYPDVGDANFYLTRNQVEVIKRHPLVY